MIKLYPQIVTVALFFLNTLETLAEKEQEAPYTANFHSTLIDDGKDLIFPSIICAKDHFKAPLSEYYLYTSPHAGAITDGF